MRGDFAPSPGICIPHHACDRDIVQLPLLPPESAMYDFILLKVILQAFIGLDFDLKIISCESMNSSCCTT
eukprot:4663423-Pleurochrysis_carterae.AAC.12